MQEKVTGLWSNFENLTAWTAVIDPSSLLLFRKCCIKFSQRSRLLKSFSAKNLCADEKIVSLDESMRTCCGQKSAVTQICIHIRCFFSSPSLAHGNYDCVDPSREKWLFNEISKLKTCWGTPRREGRPRRVTLSRSVDMANQHFYALPANFIGLLAKKSSGSTFFRLLLNPCQEHHRHQSIETFFSRTTSRISSKIQ